MMNGLEIRTVSTTERIGEEYSDGLDSPRALRAMWRKLIENAREATHRPFAEYMGGRIDAARAVRGSRRLMELKTKGSSREE